MKYAVLFFVCISAFVFANAQTSAFDKEDHIKITEAKDTLHISFRTKSFTFNSVEDLDSCLKKSLPDLTLPVVDLEVFTDVPPQNQRAIVVLLDKYRCPVVSERSVSVKSGQRATLKMRDQ